MAKKNTQIKGFTLIELLITIAIAAILFSAAAPRLTASIQSNRMSTQINELHASLSVARSEAIKRNSNITICRSSNGSACTGNWQDGWIVFIDNDIDGAVDVGDEILRIHGAIPGNITLAFSQTRVIYGSDGLARGGSNGTFTLCDTRGAESAKGLIIGITGRPRLAIDSNDSGILEDGNNNDLICSS